MSGDAKRWRVRALSPESEPCFVTVSSDGERVGLDIDGQPRAVLTLLQAERLRSLLADAIGQGRGGERSPGGADA